MHQGVIEIASQTLVGELSGGDNAKVTRQEEPLDANPGTVVP